MPVLGAPGKRGDLYARLKVQLPSQLSAEQRELFERLRTLEATGAAV
jgi:DnaJ-class molecular chaperone